MENTKSKTGAKVSATEIMELVSDTNRKVTSLLKKRSVTVTDKKTSSKLGILLSLLMSLIGVFLTVGIFLPQVYTLMGLTLSPMVKVWILVGYTAISVIVTGLVQNRKLFKLVSLLISVCPIVITIVLPLF